MTKRGAAAAGQASLDFAMGAPMPQAAPAWAHKTASTVRMFAAKSHAGEWRNFSSDADMVRICDDKDPFAVEVATLSEPTEGCGYAFQLTDGGLICISSDLPDLLLCSKDGFEKLIKAREGRIVPISIREAKE